MLPVFAFLISLWCPTLPVKAPANTVTYHPTHLSLLDSKYEPKTRTLEVAIKIFSDDLDDAILKASGKRYHLGTPQQVPGFDGADGPVATYIRQHLALTGADGRALPMAWVGMEGDLTAHWIYLEVPNLAPFQALRVQSTILFDVYADQTNVVNVEIGGTIRTLRTNASSPSGELRW